MNTTRSRAAIVLVGLALAAAGPSAGVAPASSSNGTHATSSCRSANIGGQHKCIARGQFCARRYRRDYRRYGYSCSKRDRNGRYHLR